MTSDDTDTFLYHSLDIFPLPIIPLPSRRSDGPAGHAVPGAGQHLQLGDGERAQGRGTDGRRDVGRHVHLGKYKQ